MSLAKREHDHLQEPLSGRAAVAGGLPAVEAFLQYAAGTAAGEHEMLDEFLSAPQALVFEWVELAALRRLAGQLCDVRVENLLQDGMHRQGHADEQSIWGNYTTGLRLGVRRPFL